MANKTAAVIIPVYKAEPDAIELLSLKQCLVVLKKHSIFLIAPHKLNTIVYEKIFAENSLPTQLVRFDDHYFSSIAGYNQLMLSPFFYKTFIKYRYMLIYQLDAFVFKDELDYWCSKNYDFIGAPAIPHLNKPGEAQFLKSYSKLISVFNLFTGLNHKISNVGNGGFSLRKTKTFYRLLRLLKREVKRWGLNNEDGFFKYWGNLLHPFVKLPPDEIALHFSIEHNAAQSLKKMDGALPFGCHAFEKYEPQVWKRYINF